jgi:segregation and condensation protein A
MSGFRVELDCYHGPLDLLLHLVRRRELDVLEIPLAGIVQRFLETLDERPAIDLDSAGEFLVVAATLMEFKSRLLLPRGEALEPDLEEIVQPPELVRQLLEYRQFREAGALLWQRALERQRKFRRAVKDLDAPADSAAQSTRDVELWDLVSALHRLLRENVVPDTDTIARDTTPIEEYMDRLEESVKAAGRLDFRALFGVDNTRSQIVGKFLALLELIRCGRVWVELDDVSDNIVVSPPHNAIGSMPMADASEPPDAYRRERTPGQEPILDRSSATCELASTGQVIVASSAGPAPEPEVRPVLHASDDGPLSLGRLGPDDANSTVENPNATLGADEALPPG